MTQKPPRAKTILPQRVQGTSSKQKHKINRLDRSGIDRSKTKSKLVPRVDSKRKLLTEPKSRRVLEPVSGRKHRIKNHRRYESPQNNAQVNINVNVGKKHHRYDGHGYSDRNDCNRNRIDRGFELGIYNGDFGLSFSKYRYDNSWDYGRTYSHGWRSDCLTSYSGCWNPVQVCYPSVVYCSPPPCVSSVTREYSLFGITFSEVDYYYGGFCPLPVETYCNPGIGSVHYETVEFDW